MMHSSLKFGASWGSKFLYTLCSKMKFVFFEKATKFDEISSLLLTNKFVFFVSRYSFEDQSGSQFWNFIHWDQQNLSKVILIFFSNKNQLCRI